MARRHQLEARQGKRWCFEFCCCRASKLENVGDKRVRLWFVRTKELLCTCTQQSISIKKWFCDAYCVFQFCGVLRLQAAATLWVTQWLWRSPIALLNQRHDAGLNKERKRSMCIWTNAIRLALFFVRFVGRLGRLSLVNKRRRRLMKRRPQWNWKQFISNKQ